MFEGWAITSKFEDKVERSSAICTSSSLVSRLTIFYRIRND